MAGRNRQSDSSTASTADDDEDDVSSTDSDVQTVSRRIDIRQIAACIFNADFSLRSLLSLRYPL